MKMKRTLKKTGALLLAAGLAVSSTAPAMAKDKEEQITLTIWHQSVADTDPVKKIIEDSVENTMNYIPMLRSSRMELPVNSTKQKSRQHLQQEKHRIFPICSVAEVL